MGLIVTLLNLTLMCHQFWNWKTFPINLVSSTNCNQVLDSYERILLVETSTGGGINTFSIFCPKRVVWDNSALAIWSFDIVGIFLQFSIMRIDFLEW